MLLGFVETNGTKFQVGNIVRSRSPVHYRSPMADGKHAFNFGAIHSRELSPTIRLHPLIGVVAQVGGRVHPGAVGEAVLRLLLIAQFAA